VIWAQTQEIWRSADLRAIAAGIAVLIVGAIVVAVLTDRAHAGTAITALLAVTVIIYALVSGRLSEFTAPGGWRAKFSEAADRPVDMTRGVIASTSLDWHDIEKADFYTVKQKVATLGGDGKPIVLKMIIGNTTYQAENLRIILEYLAVTRNFRALVIVDEQQKLVAYIAARQAALLVSPSLGEFREQLVVAVKTRQIPAFRDRELMTDASVPLETSYADALQQMNERSLSCIAVVDTAGQFRGIVDRDGITTTLLLALARTVRA
jgi:CBS domain-containing protein